MSSKARFLCFLCAAGLALAVLAGACKALADDGTDPDYLMPLPGGVIVRYETGNGSYVPYQAGLRPGDAITKPQDPIWPTDNAVFGGWFLDNVIFSKPWRFETDTIPADAGKNMTLYAKWQAAITERWVARNWIWENQANDIMGQVVELEPGQTYTLTVKCWMQGSNNDWSNHFVAFYLDPDTGTRTYSVRKQIFPNNLWSEVAETFTAENRWYVAGVFPSTIIDVAIHGRKTIVCLAWMAALNIEPSFSQEKLGKQK